MVADLKTKTMGDLVSWKSCNIVVVNYHGELKRHPLYLGIGSDHACKLKSTEKTFIACLKWCSLLGLRDHYCEERHQFVVVEILSEHWVESLHSPRSSCGENIILFASDIFVKHYRLDSGSLLGLKVKRVPTPISITSATLCAHTEDSYQWAKQLMNDSATSLLINVCTNPVLCRKGDVCLFPCSFTDNDRDSYEHQLQNLFHLEVVDCQPVLQGLLSLSTALTVVRADALFRQPRLGGQCEEQSLDSAAEHVVEVDDNDLFWLHTWNKTVEILKFVLVIILRYAVVSGSPKRVEAITKLLRIVLNLKNNWKRNFNVRVLSKPPVLSVSVISCQFDEFRIVFLTSATLRKNGLNDFQWVIIQLSFSDHDKTESRTAGHLLDSNFTKIRRYAQVCAVDEHFNDIDIRVFGELQDNVVYISPLLWFNLNPRPSKLIQEYATVSIQFSTKKMSTWELHDKITFTPVSISDPPFADEVHISIIQSPYYESTLKCDELLKSYFSIPRLICQQDVLCLEISDIYGAAVDFRSKGLTSLVYFFVTKIEKQKQPVHFGGLVDTLHTTLYQTGTVQSYVPLSMELYFLPASVHPIWHSPIPSGFQKQCERLTDMILPYLQSRLLRTSVLPTLCLEGTRSCGKLLLINAIARQLNMHMCVASCWEFVGETSGASEVRLKTFLQKVKSFAPCLVVLKNVHNICRDSEGNLGESRVSIALKDSLYQLMQNSSANPIFVIGTTTDSNLLSHDLASVFLHKISLQVPNRIERLDMLRTLTRDVNCGLQISLKDLVQKTAGFVLGDLCCLRLHAVTAAYYRISSLCTSGMLGLSFEDEKDLCLAGVQLIMDDFVEGLNSLQNAQSDAIGAPKIPDVKWDDIGGLEYVKHEILDTVLLPLQHPELLATGLRRSGVLLYGPPGTGKTLLAKAVATECSLSFLSVKGPELINMYVGQSEENVRKVFQRAQAAAPCIIFFDELDSLAPNRGKTGDSGGVMDRVVSQLLAELDGLHRAMDVFVIGATNRPDLLDPALLRPGRFDKLLYVGIAEDSSSQLKIMKALTRKFQLAEHFKLSEFVNKCPLHLTGADFYALCSDAVFHAMSRRIEELEKGLESNSDLIITAEDFLKALNNLTPSVSQDELKRYTNIQTTMAS